MSKKIFDNAQWQNILLICWLADAERKRADFFLLSVWMALNIFIFNVVLIRAFQMFHTFNFGGKRFNVSWQKRILNACWLWNILGWWKMTHLVSIWNDFPLQSAQWTKYLLKTYLSSIKSWWFPTKNSSIEIVIITTISCRRQRYKHSHLFDY